MKYFLAAFLIGMVPYVNGSAAEPSGVCGHACLAVERIGQDYYIVARGSAGEIVKLYPVPDSLALSESAAARLSSKLADLDSSGAPSSWPALDLEPVVVLTSGGSVETSTTPFETHTEIVIIMIATYRNEHGQAVDVDVHTIRIPKKHGRFGVA